MNEMMVSTTPKGFIVGILICCISASFLLAETTRLENDKLIFSNGGGFENEADVVSVLNLSKPGVEYRSKAVNILGDYITVDNDIQDLANTSTYKEINDKIPLGQLFTNSLGVFTFDGKTASTFPSDFQFLIGDCTKKYLVMNAQKIGAIKVLSQTGKTPTHSMDVLYIQKNKAPTYIGNVTNTGEVFTPAMSIFGQLVINGTLVDAKRVGINTKDPAEALSIVGDLKVDGALNASTGIFRPRTIYPTIQSPAVTSEWVTVARNTIKVKYASHAVFIIGSAKIYNMGEAQARISIKEKASVTATVFTDFSPNPQEENSSLVKFIGSSDQWAFSLYPAWAGQLSAFSDNPSTPIDESTFEKEYQIELQTKFTSTWSGSKAVVDPPVDGSGISAIITAPASKGAEFMILGLPDASINRPVIGSVSNESSYSQSTTFTFNPVVGNYLTENVLSFKSDGFLIDSNTGLNLLYGSGTKFKPFKAYNLKAKNIYEQQLLKIFTGTRDDSIFKIITPGSNTSGWLNGGSFLGFNSAVSLTDVSHNIQSVYSSGAVTLNLTQSNIGDGALTMNPDIEPSIGVDPVGIGTAPASGVALSVQGNVSFTGQYIGNYGRVIKKYVAQADTSNNPFRTWTTIPGSAMTGITVDKPSSGMLLSTFRIQRYTFGISRIRGRIKVSDGSTAEYGEVSQEQFIAESQMNTLFCQKAMDFDPGKSYSVELEMFLESGGVETVYELICLLVLIPSVAE